MRPLRTLALLFGALLAPAAGAAERVPYGFLGMTVEGPLLRPDVDQGREFRLMARSGVESVIAEVNWNFLQPREDEPPDFTRVDRLVGNAARRGMRVTANVVYAPGWAAVDPGNGATPPKPGPYATFLRELVLRYGPNGSFWAERPALRPVPIRDWQVWNEPPSPGFWSIQPFQKRYVELLRYARYAIKVSDPRARVVLAGLTWRSWTDLAKIYRAGGAGLFDAVSLHTYTRRPRDIPYIVRLNRRVMARHGDARLPVLITEFGWPSAKGRPNDAYGYEVTERGQAARARTALPLLARVRKRLGIQRVYWHSWLSLDHGRATFAYSGLRRLADGRVVSKPAHAAFRRAALALEGCRRKGATARRCG